MTSLIDRIVDAYYWPVVGGTSVIMVLAPIAAVTSLISASAQEVVTAGLAIACAPLFLLMLFDGETRLAVLNFNRNYRFLSWRQQLFSDAYGDRRLLICNRLVWLVGALLLLAGYKAQALLAMTGFFATTLLLILMLKRVPADRQAGPGRLDGR